MALILRHYDEFAWEGELGSTDLLRHDIKLSEETPIRLRARPLNPALTRNLQEQVDKWLRAGVIEPSASPFNFQLVPVLKKNGKRDGVLTSGARIPRGIAHSAVWSPASIACVNTLDLRRTVGPGFQRQ